MHRVVFAPKANDELIEFYRYLAEWWSRPVSQTQLSTSANLAHFPRCGTNRDDIRPGPRTIGFRQRVMIAFTVGDKTVTIPGVCSGGRDFEASLR